MRLLTGDDLVVVLLLQVFTEKVLPISAGLLSADFLVDPVTRSSPL